MEQDYLQGLEWYLKAAEQGYADGMANLGFCYGEGVIFKKDYQEALNWLRKAIDNGHSEDDLKELMESYEKKLSGPYAEIYNIWADTDGCKKIYVHCHLVVHNSKGKNVYVYMTMDGKKHVEKGVSLYPSYDSTEWRDYVFEINEMDLSLEHNKTVDYSVNIGVYELAENGDVEGDAMVLESLEVKIYYYFNFFSKSEIKIIK